MRFLRILAVLSLSSFWALIPLLDATADDSLINGSFSAEGGGWSGARYTGVGNGACQGGQPNIGTWGGGNGLFFSFIQSSVSQSVLITQPSSVTFSVTVQNRGDNSGASASVNFGNQNTGEFIPSVNGQSVSLSIETTEPNQQIQIIISGRDNRFWAGCYGSIFTSASLSVNPLLPIEPSASPTPPTPTPSPSESATPPSENAIPSPSPEPTPATSATPEPSPSPTLAPEPQPSPQVSPEVNPPTPPPSEPLPEPIPSPSPQPSPTPQPPPPPAPEPSTPEPIPAPSNPTPNPEPTPTPEEPDPVLEEPLDPPLSTDPQTESDGDSEVSIPDSSATEDSSEADDQITNPATPADNDANASFSDDNLDTDSQSQDPQPQSAIESNSNLPSKSPPDSGEEPTTTKDTKPLANGGVEIFGTPTQPQVVGEDGQLTPPPPPPGSGLPIDPEAITVAETFIGQPGGMALNSPDIAEEMVYEPISLPNVLAVVPLLGAGVESLNKAYVALTNIGVDLDPLTRKKAKKIILTAIIAQQTIATSSLSLVRR